MMRLTWSAFIVMAMSCFCHTARADLYDDYINSASKKPFISFLARKSEGNIMSKPGHSYVAIGVELDNGELVYERILGYYPASESALNEVKAVFSSVSGDLKSKLEDISWTVEFRVPVTDDQHAAALKVADKWIKNDPKYNLLANGGKNCSVFASEVATSIGLQAPTGAGSKWPVDFITELKKLNQ